MDKRETDDPYEALRLWIDPEFGGRMPPQHRDAIRRLLAERDSWVQTFADLLRRIPQNHRP
jgi:hypothetical protein